MSKRKFDTCFFERYAKVTLETILGEEYSALINEDRPDLQMEDRSLGIEVTRAMEPRKDVAHSLLREMAGLKVEESDREDVDKILSSGYGYDLQEGKYIGHLEYDYWNLARPLRRIIASKIEKVGSGFYGDFEEFGLYIFCKDNLSEEEVILTMEYASDLQRHLDIRYSKIYLSLIDKLYVCDLSDVDRLHHKTHCTSYDISRKMCKEFFIKSL